MKLAELLSHDALADYALILSTSAGTIMGHILTDEDCENDDSACAGLSSLCKHEYTAYKKSLNLSDEDHLPDNEGYIMLKDVKILRTPGTISLPIMIIFFDDIVGASIGQF